VFQVSDDGVGGVVPGALSGVRSQDGESAAVAEQGAIQQTLRRGGGDGVPTLVSYVSQFMTPLQMVTPDNMEGPEIRQVLNQQIA
jgi:hypothetical protein